MPKMIDPELKAHAVRLVLEHRAVYPTTTAAVTAVAKQVGVGKESLRRWVAQADIDTGDRPGLTRVEVEEIKKLTEIRANGASSKIQIANLHGDIVTALDNITTSTPDAWVETEAQQEAQESEAAEEIKFRRVQTPRCRTNTGY